jgi:ATP-dependent DNA helicase RecQ
MQAITAVELLRRVYACRPAYTSLWRMTEQWGTQVVACTATASALVQRDIEQHLHMKNPRCVRMPVLRTNLHICISAKGNSREAERSLARLVKRSSARRVLVFCCSRRECEETARLLVLNNQSAEANHSCTEDRQEVEARVQAGVRCTLNPVAQYTASRSDRFHVAGESRVICATIAFGLGMDLPGVGLIVHWDAATSLQAYVEQIGRGGRCGCNCLCITFYDRAFLRGAMRQAARNGDAASRDAELRNIQEV